MKKRTKMLQFSKQTELKIIERDEQCIFCKIGFYLLRSDDYLYHIADIMHIVNKSQGGLGIEQNGVLGCRYHHGLLDNGNKGLRSEMIQIINKYMTELYPGWDEKDLKFKKGW